MFLFFKEPAPGGIHLGLQRSGPGVDVGSSIQMAAITVGSQHPGAIHPTLLPVGQPDSLEPTCVSVLLPQQDHPPTGNSLPGSSNVKHTPQLQTLETKVGGSFEKVGPVLSSVLGESGLTPLQEMGTSGTDVPAVQVRTPICKT